MRTVVRDADGKPTRCVTRRGTRCCSTSFSKSIAQCSSKKLPSRS